MRIRKLIFIVFSVEANDDIRYVSSTLDSANVKRLQKTPTTLLQRQNCCVDVYFRIGC